MTKQLLVTRFCPDWKRPECDHRLISVGYFTGIIKEMILDNEITPSSDLTYDKFCDEYWNKRRDCYHDGNHVWEVFHVDPSGMIAPYDMAPLFADVVAGMLKPKRKGGRKRKEPDAEPEPEPDPDMHKCLDCGKVDVASSSQICGNCMIVANTKQVIDHIIGK